MHDLNAQYELFEELGAGRTGVTHRGRDTRTGAVMAYKLLHTDLAQRDVVGRLREQTRMAKDVDHPNIARVLELGDEGESVYLAREFVEGESLRERLAREGRQTEAETRRIALGIAHALNAAAFSRMIHRNLTPANVLLGADDRVVVSDFGLTRALDVVTPTQVIPFVAEPLYAAPEVAEGRGDIRSDLYSLGVIMFGCLMGSAADGVQAAAKKDDERSREMATLKSASPGLAPIVRRLLAENPSSRYEDPAALIQELQADPSLDATVAGELAPGVRRRAGLAAYLPLSLGAVRLNFVRELPRWAQAAAATLAAATIMGGLIFVAGKAAGGGGGDGQPPLVSGAPESTSRPRSPTPAATTNTSAPAAIAGAATPEGDVSGAEDVPELAITGPGFSIGTPGRIGVIGRGGASAPATAARPDAPQPAAPNVPRAWPTASVTKAAPPGNTLPPNTPPPNTLVPNTPPTNTPTLAPPTATPTLAAPSLITPTLSFVSNELWSVYDGSSLATPLGAAQVVCLRRTPISVPLTCPVSATSWDSSQTGTWGASLGAASWIWAPGVTRETHVDRDKHYWFRQCFTLAGRPTSGAIEIAVDGHTDIWVNGRRVEDDRGSNQIKRLDVTAYLNMGANCFAFEAVNDQCDACEYGAEPAGLLFRGTLNYAVP